MEASTGSLFRIKYPEDWADDELYDFDWTVLKNENDLFGKMTPSGPILAALEARCGGVRIVKPTKLVRLL